VDRDTNVVLHHINPDKKKRAFNYGVGLTEIIHVFFIQTDDQPAQDPSLNEVMPSNVLDELDEP
jgi:hypothetical protein